MRALLVTPDYPPPPGGIQTVVQNLENGLMDLGHNPIVLHLNPGEHNREYRDFLPSGITISSVRSMKPHLHTYFNSVYRQATKAIAEYKPDVVHALHIRNWPALYAAQKENIPTIVSTHALELQEIRLCSVAFSNATAIHAVSEFTGSLIQRDHGIYPDKIIPPSIRVEEYKRDFDPPSDVKVRDTKSVFSIARFVERKNIDTIVEAWTRLDNTLRKNYQLELAGTGPLYDSIVQQTKGIDDIHLLGRISEEEKRRRLQNAQLFVLPASGSGYDVEGFGIVYLEAQAAGTPVIGSSIGGVPEAIGDAGLRLKDEQDPNELAKKMETLLTAKDVRRDCLQAAEDRVDKFDIIPITNQYLNLYNNFR